MYAADFIVEIAEIALDCLHTQETENIEFILGGEADSLLLEAFTVDCTPADYDFKAFFSIVVIYDGVEQLGLI